MSEPCPECERRTELWNKVDALAERVLASHGDLDRLRARLASAEAVIAEAKLMRHEVGNCDGACIPHGFDQALEAYENPLPVGTKREIGWP
jgi:hypothetical protein